MASINVARIHEFGGSKVNQVESEDFIKSLGADYVIDYGKEHFSKPDAGGPDAQGKPGVFFLVEPGGSQLQEIADMMASGKPQITLDMTLELDEATQAQRYLEEAQVQGKVVLSIVG